MAGASKRSRPDGEAEAEEEYQSDESGNYNGPQEIQATFEGRNPEGQDFHGIKQLLNQLFPSAHIDLGQMSDMIINQNGIGSVLKQSYNDSDDEEDIEMVEESDVFGITTAINLTSHRETPCIKQLCEFVDEENLKQSDPVPKTRFKEILTGSNKLGWLINERFVNIPSKISAIMLGSLYEEVARMRKKDNSYDFDYFLMIAKLWKPKNKSDEEQFANDEEQLFANSADVSFEFSVAGKSDTGLTGKWQSEDKEMIPFRRVMLFKANKFEGILNQVKIYVA